MSSSAIYVNRRPSMHSELLMKFEQEIGQEAMDLAADLAEAIPEGVGSDVAGAAIAKLLASIVAYETDGDIDRALKITFYLSNLIGVLTIRECADMADKSGEKNQ